MVDVEESMIDSMTEYSTDTPISRWAAVVDMRVSWIHGKSVGQVLCSISIPAIAATTRAAEWRTSFLKETSS